MLKGISGMKFSDLCIIEVVQRLLLLFLNADFFFYIMGSVEMLAFNSE